MRLFYKLISLSLFIPLACGEEDKKVAVVDSSLYGRCLVTLKSSSQTQHCIDYQNLTSAQLDITETSCADSDTETKVFTKNSLCDDAGKLGGCQLPASEGIIVTTWTYSSNDAAVDDGLTTLAKDSCENPSEGNVKGTWMTP